MKLKLKFEINWTTPEVETRQREIRAILNHISNEQGKRKKSKIILEMIEKLPDSLSPEVLLDRYILAMSGLKMAIDGNYYNSATTKKLLEQARSVLEIIGHDLRTSRLGFLQADYYRFKSQLELRNGSMISSKWYLEEARYFSGRGMRDEQRLWNDLLGFAIRLHREGNLQEAKTKYKEFISSNNRNFNFDRARLGLLEVYRLLGLKNEFTELHDQLVNSSNTITSSHVQWEMLVHEVQNGKDLNTLNRHYKKNKLGPDYLIDLYFRVYCHPQTKLIGKLPSLRTKREVTSFDHRRLGSDFLATEILEKLYDSKIGMHERISMVGEFLPRRTELSTFEFQVMFIGGVLRWTQRKRLQGFTKVLTEEYQKLTYLQGHLFQDPCIFEENSQAA